MEYVLTVNALSKRYRRFPALSGLNMRVPKGAIYGLVGKNGAGKTTLIRVVCGLQEPTEGDYTLYGVHNREREILDTRKRLGAVVEAPAIYLDMTAEENLKEQYRILGLPSFDQIPELLKLVGLADTGKKKARQFSLGMKQRLGIAIALCGDPDFLILDEPANGLDPQGIIEIRELILKLNRERQITVLISSHILDELSRLATHYGFIDDGHMVQEISAKELIAACRKSVILKVSDVEAASLVLIDAGLEYEIVSEGSGTRADDSETTVSRRAAATQGAVAVYGEVAISELVLSLAEANCQVLSMENKDESLESYYINLVGGEHNE